MYCDIGSLKTENLSIGAIVLDGSVPVDVIYLDEEEVTGPSISDFQQDPLSQRSASKSPTRLLMKELAGKKNQRPTMHPEDFERIKESRRKLGYSPSRLLNQNETLSTLHKQDGDSVDFPRITREEEPCFSKSLNRDVSLELFGATPNPMQTGSSHLSNYYGRKGYGNSPFKGDFHGSLNDRLERTLSTSALKTKSPRYASPVDLLPGGKPSKFTSPAQRKRTSNQTRYASPGDLPKTSEVSTEKTEEPGKDAFNCLDDVPDEHRSNALLSSRGRARERAITQFEDQSNLSNNSQEVSKHMQQNPFVTQYRANGYQHPYYPASDSEKLPVNKNSALLQSLSETDREFELLKSETRSKIGVIQLFSDAENMSSRLHNDSPTFLSSRIEGSKMGLERMEQPYKFSQSNPTSYRANYAGLSQDSRQGVEDVPHEIIITSTKRNVIPKAENYGYLDFRVSTKNNKLQTSNYQSRSESPPGKPTNAEPGAKKRVMRHAALSARERTKTEIPFPLKPLNLLDQKIAREFTYKPSQRNSPAVSGRGSRRPNIPKAGNDEATSRIVADRISLIKDENAIPPLDERKGDSSIISSSWVMDKTKYFNASDIEDEKERNSVDRRPNTYRDNSRGRQLAQLSASPKKKSPHVKKKIFDKTEVVIDFPDADLPNHLVPDKRVKLTPEKLQNASIDNIMKQISVENLREIKTDWVNKTPMKGDDDNLDDGTYRTPSRKQKANSARLPSPARSLSAILNDHQYRKNPESHRENSREDYSSREKNLSRAGSQKDMRIALGLNEPRQLIVSPSERVFSTSCYTERSHRQSVHARKSPPKLESFSKGRVPILEDVQKSDHALLTHTQMPTFIRSSRNDHFNPFENSLRSSETTAIQNKDRSGFIISNSPQVKSRERAVSPKNLSSQKDLKHPGEETQKTHREQPGLQKPPKPKGKLVTHQTTTQGLNTLEERPFTIQEFRSEETLADQQIAFSNQSMLRARTPSPILEEFPKRQVGANEQRRRKPSGDVIARGLEALETQGFSKLASTFDSEGSLMPVQMPVQNKLSFGIPSRSSIGGFN